MSVQFGRCTFERQPIAHRYLERVEQFLAPYGPDGGNSYSSPDIHILYRALDTTRESRLETQPRVTASGAVLTWTGCLDNRKELEAELRGSAIATEPTDVAIVAAAYDQWGTECLAKLIGDWALSVWTPKTNSLLLAKDPIGTHHLHYALDEKQVLWCTILDPLVLLAEDTLALSEEYLAGWLTFFPATHLTPYVGIYSVPPSCSVLIRGGKKSVTRYWDFDPSKTTRYLKDSDYEEHFRSVFAQSLRRKLRSNRPILAELSGGMDSSAIVCMADGLIAEGCCDTVRLDTVSFYDDDEPNWNERPFFTKVEEKRGRSGCHIDVSSDPRVFIKCEKQTFAATPAAEGQISDAKQQLAKCLTSLGSRVVLSGIGGDEVLGGVPTGVPELANLIAGLKLCTLVRQLVAWSLPNRRPVYRTLAEALRCFLPAPFGVAPNRRPPAWLQSDFVGRHRKALRGYETRLKMFGPLPSFQENLATLELLRRQLSCSTPSRNPLYEKRYPYLDRSLLEFLYAIPREQLVRPGERRSLMRRALAGIVPDELLNRKRKAFIARRPRNNISENWRNLTQTMEQMTPDCLNVVNREAFLQTLEGLSKGQDIPIISAMRTLRMEIWVRHLYDRKVLEATPGPTVTNRYEMFRGTERGGT